MYYQTTFNKLGFTGGFVSILPFLQRFSQIQVSVDFSKLSDLKKYVFQGEGVRRMKNNCSTV